MKEKDNFLVIKDLTVSFSRWGQTVEALRKVTLIVPTGQWLILVGPNGSGKSTLLETISGRTSPEEGQVLINGRNIDTFGAVDIAQSVFHVHQDPLLGTAPILTVFENLMVADDCAQSNRETRKLLETKYSELLKPLGLSARLKQPVRTLSGGERQLLTLAIASLRPSMLVLLDEPLAALDPAKTEMCMAEISKLHRQGKTLIQVSHDQELAFSVGDRTVALNQGHIVYDEAGSARSFSEIRERWHSPVLGETH